MHWNCFKTFACTIVVYWLLGNENEQSISKSHTHHSIDTFVSSLGPFFWFLFAFLLSHALSLSLSRSHSCAQHCTHTLNLINDSVCLLKKIFQIDKQTVLFSRHSICWSRSPSCSIQRSFMVRNFLHVRSFSVVIYESMWLEFRDYYSIIIWNCQVRVFFVCFSIWIKFPIRDRTQSIRR